MCTCEHGSPSLHGYCDHCHFLNVDVGFGHIWVILTPVAVKSVALTESSACKLTGVSRKLGDGTPVPDKPWVDVVPQA